MKKSRDKILTREIKFQSRVISFEILKETRYVKNNKDNKYTYTFKISNIMLITTR